VLVEGSRDISVDVRLVPGSWYNHDSWFGHGKFGGKLLYWSKFLKKTVSPFEKSKSRVGDKKVKFKCVIRVT